MKILKNFRVELETWKQFKQTTVKPTRTIRDFVEWYLKHHELWYYLKNILVYKIPCCFICNKEVDFKTEEKNLLKEQKSLYALSNGFKVCLVVSKNFEVEIKWFCENCWEKIESLKLPINDIL